MDVGAIGKGKGGKKGDGKKGEAKKVDGKRRQEQRQQRALARARVRAPRSLMATVTTARSTGTWHETVPRKRLTMPKKQKNVGAVDQSSVQSTSSTASVGAVALVSSTSAGSGLGRLVMAISDQGERFDAYQVFDGTRPEVVVMMAIDSGNEVHTAPVTFPWNVEQFDKTSICLSDVQGDKLKVYGTALLNYGVVSDTVKFVLSVGELGRHGWSTTLGPLPCLTHKAGCQVHLTRKANTFYLSARLGFNGEAPWKMVATTTTSSAASSPSGRE